MKQVTMESVKERIARIENAEHVIKCANMCLSMQNEFELACLRELVAVTEQRDAVVAEMVSLKGGDAFFSYGSEHGFEWHKTAKEAVENAEAAIDGYRGDACDGWSEEVSSICWGVIMQSSTMVGERPRTEDDRCDSAIDTICDYALLPAIETPATDAIRDSLRAEGVEMFAESQKEYVRVNHNSLGAMTCAAYCGSAVDAEKFARQLRESKGANHE